MKKVLIYFIMVTYLNMALVPHLKEQNIYIPGTTQEVDEINSLYEKIMVGLGYDTTAEDEDGDSGTEDDCTVIPFTVFSNPHILQVGLTFNSWFFQVKQKSTFSSIDKFNLSSIDFGIESPPPEV